MGDKNKRRQGSPLAGTQLTLPPIELWYATSAVLAVVIVILIAWKRRQERSVKEFAEQVWQLTRGAGAFGRIRLEDKPQALERLGTAVNKLLENLEQRGARLQDREQLFQRLVETVHDAVLVHRDRILFANSRFLALLNLGAGEVVGKPLTDFVAPEYVELVGSNLKRRLQGEPGGSATRSSSSARMARSLGSSCRAPSSTAPASPRCF